MPAAGVVDSLRTGNAGGERGLVDGVAGARGSRFPAAALSDRDCILAAFGIV